MQQKAELETELAKARASNMQLDEQKKQVEQIKKVGRHSKYTRRCCRVRSQHVT